jgi:hypothetical protein
VSIGASSGGILNDPSASSQARWCCSVVDQGRRDIDHQAMMFTVARLGPPDSSRTVASAGTGWTGWTSPRVSQPGDRYERAADRAAAQVMRGLAPPSASIGAWAAPSSASITPGAGPAPTSPARSVVDPAVSSPGRPLAAETRRFMESRFGHDISRVRVHADTAAADAALGLGARAFTVGEHIVLGRAAGEVARAPLPLLAHELAHVVQGRSLGPNLPVMRQPETAPEGQKRSASRVPAEAVGLEEALRP